MRLLSILNYYQCVDISSWTIYGSELFIEEEVAFEVNIISLSEWVLEYDKNSCQEKKEI